MGIETVSLKARDVDTYILFKWLKDCFTFTFNYKYIDINFYNIEIIGQYVGDKVPNFDDTDEYIYSVRFRAFPSSATTKSSNGQIYIKPIISLKEEFWETSFTIPIQEYNGYIRDERIDSILNFEYEG